MEMMAISKLYLTSEGTLHFFVLQLIQMDNRRRSKRLAENPAVLPSLDFLGQYISKIFPLMERRENLTLLHSVSNLCPARSF